MPELNASLETSKPNSPANSQPDNSAVNNGAPNKTEQPNKPRSLADIFGNKSDETNLDISLEDDTPDDPNEPVDSIDRLMKRQKLTPEQAYAIKIPMKDGAEALTIGQLKDRVGELVDFETREMEFEERRIRQEGELLRSQSELRDLLSILPKDAIKPEVLEKLRKRQETTVRNEKRLTIEHIPEWRDEKRRSKEIEGMIDMLGDYGFEPSFLDTVVDHRVVKFLRDTFIIRERIRKSLAEVRDPKRLGVRPSGKGKVGKAPADGSNARRNHSPTNRDRLMDYLSKS